MDTALSDSDIRHNGINVLLYHQLRGMTSQNVLNSLPLAILYQVKPEEGHWTLLHRTPEGIEHFDPYGIVVDKEFESLEWKQPHYLAKILEQLSKTMQVNYNQYPFQKKDPRINTCGRWVILRHKFSDLGIDRFKRMIDEVGRVTGLTNDQIAVESFKK
jgi:hypothetical protein